MNPEATALPESPRAAHATPAATIPESRRLYWLLQRELWENRSIYIAPLAIAALFLAGFLIGLLHAPAAMRDQWGPDAMQPFIMGKVYNFAALLIMGTTFLVTLFYCLEALHGERNDRSILFWKSLPVSDLTTVLSKASIAIVALPLITFAVTVITQALMLVLSSAVLLGRGQNIAVLWTRLTLFQMPLATLYHLLTVHALWYAPLYAYLLLVSAWARRAPFLWAVLPPIAIAVVEKIAFNTSHFAAMIGHRLGGGPDGDALALGNMQMNPLIQLTPGQFLISPGLWIGLAVAAAFLAAAVQLRRYRGPI